jgi:hypothetical protein
MMPAAPAAAAVLEFIRGHPYWALRFLLVYLGNPILFVAYFAALAGRSYDASRTLLGIKTFKPVATNTCRINIGMFVLVTLPLYLLWFFIQLSVIPVLFRASPHTLNVGTFCAHYAGLGACLAAIPGVLNMHVWSTSGMEGNVMGFAFALPLLVAAGAYVVLWFVAVCTSFEVYDQPILSPSPSAA